MVNVSMSLTRSSRRITIRCSVLIKYAKVRVHRSKIFNLVVFLGTSGQFCGKYRGQVAQLPENCEFCGSKAVFVDGEVAGLYGYTSLVLPKATLIVGNRTFRSNEEKPKYSYLDSKTRHGLLPDEINPQLFRDPNGKASSNIYKDLLWNFATCK